MWEHVYVERGDHPRIAAVEAPKSRWNLGEQREIGLRSWSDERGGMALEIGSHTHTWRWNVTDSVELLNHTDKFKDAGLKNPGQGCEESANFTGQRVTKKACEEVLKEASLNVKALYRRAKAECGLKNFQECIRDCKRVVEIDSRNKDARAWLMQGQVGQ